MNSKIKSSRFNIFEKLNYNVNNEESCKVQRPSPKQTQDQLVDNRGIDYEESRFSSKRDCEYQKEEDETMNKESISEKSIYCVSNQSSSMLTDDEDLQELSPGSCKSTGTCKTLKSPEALAMNGNQSISPAWSFTIPKRSGIKEGSQLLEVKLDSREYHNEIGPVINRSFFLKNSCHIYKPYQAFLLVNKHLEQEAKKLLTEGLKINNTKESWLGSASMGVSLQKHADLTGPEEQKPHSVLHIMIFKVLKGKSKLIHPQPNCMLEPTPNCECHMSALKVDFPSCGLKTAYFYTQYYLYEYNEDQLESIPRHICPYALVIFNFDISTPSLTQHGFRPSVKAKAEKSISLSKEMTRRELILWHGQLWAKNLFLSEVKILSWSLLIQPSQLPSRLNVSIKVPITAIKDQLLHQVMSINPYQEVFMGGSYFTYLQMRPHCNHRGFNDFVTYLQNEKVGALGCCESSVEYILLPPCSYADELGLHENKEDFVLHCIFFSTEALINRLTKVRELLMAKKIASLLPTPSSTIFEDGYEQNLSLSKRVTRKTLALTFRQQHNRYKVLGSQPKVSGKRFGKQFPASLKKKHTLAFSKLVSTSNFTPCASQVAQTKEVIFPRLSLTSFDPRLNKADGQDTAQKELFHSVTNPAPTHSFVHEKDCTYSSVSEPLGNKDAQNTDILSPSSKSMQNCTQKKVTIKERDFTEDQTSQDKSANNKCSSNLHILSPISDSTHENNFKMETRSIGNKNIINQSCHSVSGSSFMTVTEPVFIEKHCSISSPSTAESHESTTLSVSTPSMSSCSQDLLKSPEEIISNGSVISPDIPLQKPHCLEQLLNKQNDSLKTELSESEVLSPQQLGGQQRIDTVDDMKNFLNADLLQEEQRLKMSKKFHKQKRKKRTLKKRIQQKCRLMKMIYEDIVKLKDAEKHMGHRKIQVPELSKQSCINNASSDTLPPNEVSPLASDLDNVFHGPTSSTEQSSEENSSKIHNGSIKEESSQALGSILDFQNSSTGDKLKPLVVEDGEFHPVYCAKQEFKSNIADFIHQDSHVQISESPHKEVILVDFQRHLDEISSSFTKQLHFLTHCWDKSVHENNSSLKYKTLGQNKIKPVSQWEEYLSGDLTVLINFIENLTNKCTKRLTGKDLNQISSLTNISKIQGTKAAEPVVSPRKKQKSHFTGHELEPENIGLVQTPDEEFNGFSNKNNVQSSGNVEKDTITDLFNSLSHETKTTVMQKFHELSEDLRKSDDSLKLPVKRKLKTSLMTISKRKMFQDSL
ncbi:uncharacterized protein LOC106468708 isoform X2 [Limulus polyphemus]|uniref:Uncharacterized protein LOC106468708 isoform X2 n=1 Tax=Limulus polyphemus TaxID=6850 RepID=A0ABM1TA73_LIMPO|nr:uncharacterized protein LOC106468708 isoform X2 [Limulus polyphemus]